MPKQAVNVKNGALFKAVDDEEDRLEELLRFGRDIVYELRRLGSSDPLRERKRATLAAIGHFDAAAAAIDAAALGAFAEGEGLEALSAYCLPYMRFDRSPEGEYGFWPDLETLEEDASNGDGVIKVTAGDAWPPLWTSEGRDLNFVVEVNDHGNVTLYSRRRVEVWSCV